MLLNRFQYPRRPNDCRIQQVFFRIRDIKVKRTGSMDHDFKRWVGLDGLIESTGLGNVLDYYVVELVLRHVLVVVEDCLALLGSANGCDDGVASFKQHIEYVGCYEAGTTCHWY